MTVSLTQKLIEEHVLVCPKCKTPKLVVKAEGYHCGSCMISWPAHCNVPDFFNKYVESERGVELAVAQEFVDRICDVLALGKDPATVEAVSSVLSRASKLKTEVDSLTAEIEDVYDRFFGKDKFDHPAPDAQANQGLGVVFERHYFAPRAGKSEAFSANVRVRNAGEQAWSSRTRNPVALKAEWRGLRGESAYAHFPIDVAPGRAITMPIRMTAPKATGDATVRITLDCSGSREQASQYLDISVAVGAVRTDHHHVGMVRFDPPIADYGKDHQDAQAFLLSYLTREGISRSRILEIGSGPHPQLAWLEDSEVVALDISAPLLELGSLYFGDRFTHRLAFVCADAFDPPFAPGSFDVVGMFSTLHHFPEPDLLLKKLSGLLRPAGVLAVMCEPVGDSLAAASTVRDLLKGINEQVFSTSEYLRIFEAAGLVPLSAKVSGGSLKAILGKK
jgi:hypothetical protein